MGAWAVSPVFLCYPWFATAGYTRGRTEAIQPRIKLTESQRDTLYEGRITASLPTIVVVTPITITYSDGTGSYSSTIPAGTYNKTQVVDYFYSDLLANYPSIKIYKDGEELVILSRKNRTVTISSTDPTLINATALPIGYGVDIAYSTTPSITLPANTYMSIRVVKNNIN